MGKESMTTQSKHIYDSLPEEIRDATKKVPMEYKGYLSLIQSHLKTIYGMRADQNRCIDNYQKQNKGVKIDSYSDILELSLRELKNMIEEEEVAFKSLENKISYLKEYVKKRDTYSNEEYVYQTVKCAQIIGVAPEASEQAIYKYIIDRTNISEKEAQELNEKFVNNLNLISIIILIVSHLFTPGIALEFS